MKLSKYFEIVKPKYCYILITPNYSIRNNSTDAIARAISSTYRNIIANIKTEESKLIKVLGREFLLSTKLNYSKSSKCSYFVYIEKERVEFYFIVPEQYKSIIKEKISDVWQGVTTTEVGEIPWFSKTAVKSQLVYKNEDALSLRTDRRSNELLNSNLNIIDVMEEGDKVGLFYNFMPINQFTWGSTYKNTLKKVKAKLPVERNVVSFGYALKLIMASLGSITNDISNSVKTINSTPQGDGNALVMALESVNKKEVSQHTDSKATSTILGTQIVIVSESKDRLRQLNNLKSLTNSFDCLASDDNHLKAKRHGKKFAPTDYNVRAEINKTSDKECQNFISLAGRDILEKYTFIDQVNTRETQVPAELRKGDISIGYNTYRGEQQKAYLSTDSEYKYLTLVLIGPTRAGKSTLIGNIANDSLEAQECNIIFDFCGNAELSNEISEMVDCDRVLNIDCSDTDNLQGLGYNEVKQAKNIFEQYRNAKSQTTQLLTLVNSINTADKFLAPKMERYLIGAALITFIQGGSFRDVFRVLQSHKTRLSCIDRVPLKHKESLEEYIDSLRELDETKDIKEKGEVVAVEIIGTKFNLIAGIIDRLNKLKQNSYMELMLKKDCSNNFDLVQEIQKSQLICLKMPENMFNTDQERDIYCTYWITKIWLALQMRKWEFKSNNTPESKMTKVNIIIDELSQVEHTEEFLRDKLSRLAKFKAKPIISCHYLNQISIIREELRSANASYMLIAGSDSQNYNELKTKLYPYTVEDLGNLKRYESLNIIKTKDGEAKFITLLPSPIKN